MAWFPQRKAYVWPDYHIKNIYGIIFYILKNIHIEKLLKLLILVIFDNITVLLYIWYLIK